MEIDLSQPLPPDPHLSAPLDAPVDEDALLADTRTKRTQWRHERQPHEAEWFINAAMVRGNHYVEWNAQYRRLDAQKVPPHRVRLKVNRIQAKFRARLSKFVKSKPRPIVVPATAEYQDYLNAKATQKMLELAWRKLRLERRFKEALLWAGVAGKGFWWFHWDPTKLARVQKLDPLTGAKSYVDQELGDVEIEVGSPFEILVADSGAMTLDMQPEIMRLKMRKVEDLKQRYPEKAHLIVASREEESIFTYERQIAGLNPHTFSSGAKKSDEAKDEVLVTEHFFARCGKYPQGHYRVIAGEVLLRAEDTLPYGFADLENPFPVVEFIDFPVAGQFWTPTIVAQVVDLQREYNLLRSKLAEHYRLHAHPKLLVAKQHQIPKTSWTSEAGEIVTFVGIPNLPPPTPWAPPPMSQDIWRAIEMLRSEFDDLYQIFPASEGKAGQATSGFQTNLLQEAADSVHAPDIRQVEISVEEATWKIRRLMKQFYGVPRLVTSMGSGGSVEALEFVADSIDEMADLVVEVGSGLPMLKAAKQETIMNLFKSGVLGDPADPEVRRKALGQLEMGSMEETFDLARADESQARLENKELSQGIPPQPPHFWENHQVHYTYHTQQLKSADVRNWDPMQTRALVAHTILHARFINPQSALQIAIQENIPEVIPIIQQMLMGMMGPAMGPGAPPAGPSGPSGPPPQGPPTPGPSQGPPPGVM